MPKAKLNMTFVTHHFTSQYCFVFPLIFMAPIEGLSEPNWKSRTLTILISILEIILEKIMNRYRQGDNGEHDPTTQDADVQMAPADQQNDLHNDMPTWTLHNRRNPHVFVKAYAAYKIPQCMGISSPIAAVKCAGNEKQVNISPTIVHCQFRRIRGRPPAPSWSTSPKGPT